MATSIERRRFLQGTGLAAAGLALPRTSFAAAESPDKLFDISLAQWSLNRQFFSFLGRDRGGNVEKLDPQDFAIISKREFGIEGVEYVNQFYMDAALNHVAFDDAPDVADPLGCFAIGAQTGLHAGVF